MTGSHKAIAVRSASDRVSYHRRVCLSVLLAGTLVAACSGAGSGPGNASPKSESPSGVSADATVESKTMPDSGASASTATTSGLGPVVPAGLFDGGRPPQFVIVSFDGAADPAIMKHWLDIGAASGAHLTFFLSAVYLLTKQARNVYQGPGHATGASAIGFSPTPAGLDDKTYVASIVRSLQQSVAAGNEIGNHYGGHWCGSAGVNTWSKSDWAAELNQVESLVLNVDQNNELDPPVGPPYDPFRVAGSRTPCLEGKLDQLYPVLKARGYRYDASNTRGLFDWPIQRAGIWAFGFAGINISGLARPTISVDYSISTGFNGDAVKGILSTAQTQQIRISVREAYLRAFDTLYYGNRAPFEVGNHFNHSDGDAYNGAVEDFLRTVCARPEVVCATYGEAVGWLDTHRDLISTLEAGRFTKHPRP